METKVKQHFIISKQDKGSKYILDIYEVVKKGKINRIGVVSAQYGSHKGETSEAYTFLREAGVINKPIIKAIAEAQKSRGISGNYNSYYYYSFAEQFGLLIELI